MDSYDPFILVLSGQSDLRRIMEFAVMEPFNQRIAIRYHMPPLSPEQMKLAEADRQAAELHAEEIVIAAEAEQKILDEFYATN